MINPTNLSKAIIVMTVVALLHLKGIKGKRGINNSTDYLG
jgi:hypothetical protein